MMIMTFKQWRACGRKRRFYTPEQARRCQPKMTVYQCDHCGRYHLTKQIDQWAKHVLMRRFAA
jgi:hypothetical protein